MERRVAQDFESLAAEHKDAVYRQLIRTCGNQEDAEDVLVEALLKAYQHLDQLREHSAFRPWLAQIGRRVCWHLKEREALRPLMPTITQPVDILISVRPGSDKKTYLELSSTLLFALKKTGLVS